MLSEGVPIETRDTGNLQNVGIAQGPLHPMAYGMVEILGLDNRNGNAVLPLQYIVCKFLLFLVTGGHIAADDDRSWR